MLQSLAATLFLLAAGTSARVITVRNACPFTVWPGLFTGEGTAPDFPTGWEAGSNTQVEITVPDNWRAGRIWARRNCDFSSGSTGPDTCISGGCNGGFECVNPGVPPLTLAEFTLSGDGGRDFYDVSLVDGANIPMSIVPSVDCEVADCPVDLGPECPPELVGPFDPSGFPLGCASSCIANLSGDPANSPNCCSGDFDTPETCPVENVQFYDFFKSRCPNAYAFAYDEPSGALKTCPTASGANFAITFCP